MSCTYNKFLYKSDKEGRKVSLKSIKLVEDETWEPYGGLYALDVTYLIETPEYIEELHIPRVRLPISIDSVHIFEEHDPIWNTTHRQADIGFGPTSIDLKDAVAYTVKTIKEKTKEMTLEEIEKKLGHKVKIISKEVGM